MVGKAKDDGGPAFPTDNTSTGYCGMSLRDWFAGQALADCVAMLLDGYQDAATIASACYELAAAMLAERAKEVAE